MEKHLLISLLTAAALLPLACLLTAPRGRHARNRRTARRVYRRLHGGALCDGAALRYMRQVNPFVFEELVLHAFGRCGYRVRRNRRYTGDGGVDGRMRRRGRRYLLQIKRYSGYVNAADVQAFSELCRRSHCRGAFVHTGRTGRLSWEIAQGDSHIAIVSGKALVGLVCRGENPLRTI